MSVKSIIDEQEVTVENAEGTEVRYRFRLESAGDVYTMLVSAADMSGRAIRLKDGDHYVGVVLMAQADMIEQGLHVIKDRDPEMMKDIERFHQHFGLAYDGDPRILEPKLFEFRKRFMQEELDEWAEEQPALIEALTADDGGPDHRPIALGLHQQLDALVDLCYVTLGCAYLQFGRKIFNDAWHRVQAANMAKQRVSKPGQSKRGADEFDVVKPEGWQPPDHHDLVKNHAHKIYRQGGEINDEHLKPKVPETNTANQ